MSSQSSLLQLLRIRRGRSFRTAGLSAVLLAASVLVASAQLVINVGDQQLAPNTAGQVITLYVQNTGSSSAQDVPVAGLSFDVLINNDTSDTTIAPNMTGVDIITGTVFSGNNTGQQNPSLHFHRWNASTTTSSGTVTLTHGTTTPIGTITLDTTGINSAGSWSLALGVYNGGTHYQNSVGDNIYPSITEGTLTVVPEPNAAAIVGGILVLGAGIRRWKLGRV